MAPLFLFSNFTYSVNPVSPERLEAWLRLLFRAGFGLFQSPLFTVTPITCEL